MANQPLGAVDGIESDGHGGLIATDFVGGRLLHVLASGDVRVLAQFSKNCADIGCIASRSLFFVPCLSKDRVDAYDLTAALK